MASLLEARNPDVDAVVVARLDRLGRDASEALSCLRKFASGSVGLVSIADRIDLSTPVGCKNPIDHGRGRRCHRPDQGRTLVDGPKRTWAVRHVLKLAGTTGNRAYPVPLRLTVDLPICRPFLSLPAVSARL